MSHVREEITYISNKITRWYFLKDNKDSWLQNGDLCYGDEYTLIFMLKYMTTFANNIHWRTAVVKA